MWSGDILMLPISQPVNNETVYYSLWSHTDKITECWLAEAKGSEGIFFLITRALFAMKSAWLLDSDWLSTPALSGFPASMGFWKGISETDHFCYFILTWKEIDMQKDFSSKNCIKRGCPGRPREITKCGPSLKNWFPSSFAQRYPKLS